MQNTDLSLDHQQFLADTIARNKATYGGYFMEDEPAPVVTEPVTEPVVEPEPEVEPVVETETEVEPEPTDDEDSKLDLDSAKAALAKVRKEAGTSRAKLRDLEAKFKDAKTPEQVAEVVAQLAADNATETRSLLVENVALLAGLAPEFHDRLKGDTREELEADAKALAKLTGKKAKVTDPKLSGGLTPEGDEPVFDVAAAREAARAAKRARR